MTEAKIDTRTLDIAQLEQSTVTQVYSGRDGHCCCGCRGTHYVPSTAAGLKRAEDRCSTVSDRMVKKVVGIIKSRHALAADGIERGGNHVATVVGTRLYVAYFD